MTTEGKEDKTKETSASPAKDPLSALDDVIVFHEDKEDDFDFRVPEDDDYDIR